MYTYVGSYKFKCDAAMHLHLPSNPPTRPRMFMY
jgi:hypothetical protein